jgi:hypothetical protein
MTTEWLMTIILWCQVAPDKPAEKECRQYLIRCVRESTYPEECFVRKSISKEEVVR